MIGVAEIMRHFPYLGIFLLLILGDIGLPFPEDTTLILSGFLVQRGVINFVPTLAVVYVGLLLTDYSLYLVGKKCGRRVLEHRMFRRIISPGVLARLEEKFKKWGILVVFFGRHLLGLRAQIFLAAGVMRMYALKFILADAISAVVTVTLMFGLGYLGGNSIEVLRRDITKIGHIVIVALALVAAAWTIFTFVRDARGFKDRL